MFKKIKSFLVKKLFEENPAYCRLRNYTINLVERVRLKIDSLLFDNFVSVFIKKCKSIIKNRRDKLHRWLITQFFIGLKLLKIKTTSWDNRIESSKFKRELRLFIKHKKLDLDNSVSYRIYQKKFFLIKNKIKEIKESLFYGKLVKLSVSSKKKIKIYLKSQKFIDLVDFWWFPSLLWLSIYLFAWNRKSAIIGNVLWLLYPFILILTPYWNVFVFLCGKGMNVLRFLEIKMTLVVEYAGRILAPIVEPKVISMIRYVEKVAVPVINLVTNFIKNEIIPIVEPAISPIIEFIKSFF
jgi:hypothetical protein